MMNTRGIAHIFWHSVWVVILTAGAARGSSFRHDATGNLVNIQVSAVGRPALPCDLPPVQVGLGRPSSLRVPLGSADFQSAVSPASSRQAGRTSHRVELASTLHLTRLADWKSATQQTGSLRYGLFSCPQSSISRPIVSSLVL